MARATMYSLVNQMLENKLEGLLREWRRTGFSFDDMSDKLFNRAGVDVSRETIRRWCHNLGLEGKEAEADEEGVA